MVSVVNNLSFRRRLLFALSFPTGLFAADFITAYTTENTSTPAFLMSAAALGGYVVASRRARIHKLAILESLNAGKPSVSQYHRGRRFIQKCYMSVFGSLASSALLYAVWTESENQLRQAWNSKGVLYDFATAVFSPSEEQRIQRMEEQAVPGSQLTRARRSYWHRLVDEATTIGTFGGLGMAAAGLPLLFFYLRKGVSWSGTTGILGLGAGFGVGAAVGDLYVAPLEGTKAQQRIKSAWHVEIDPVFVPATTVDSRLLAEELQRMTSTPSRGDSLPSLEMDFQSHHSLRHCNDDNHEIVTSQQPMAHDVWGGLVIEEDDESSGQQP